MALTDVIKHMVYFLESDAKYNASVCPVVLVFSLWEGFLFTQAHAARTGHQQFAESSEAIRPLTDEEKQEQLKQ